MYENEKQRRGKNENQKMHVQGVQNCFLIVLV